MRRTAFIAVVALLVAASAPAQRIHSAGRLAGSTGQVTNPAGVDLTPCLFVLNLSDAQRLQVRQIIDAEQPAITAIADRLKADHTALDSVVNVASPDSCAVGTAYLKIAADNRALQAEFTTIRTKVENVLTPDQRSRLDGCLSVLANLGQKP